MRRGSSASQASARDGALQDPLAQGAGGGLRVARPGDRAHHHDPGRARVEDRVEPVRVDAADREPGRRGPGRRDVPQQVEADGGASRLRRGRPQRAHAEVVHRRVGLRRGRLRGRVRGPAEDGPRAQQRPDRRHGQVALTHVHDRGARDRRHVRPVVHGPQRAVLRRDPRDDLLSSSSRATSSVLSRSCTTSTRPRAPPAGSPRGRRALARVRAEVQAGVGEPGACGVRRRRGEGGQGGGGLELTRGSLAPARPPQEVLWPTAREPRTGLRGRRRRPSNLIWVMPAKGAHMSLSVHPSAGGSAVPGEARDVVVVGGGSSASPSRGVRRARA